MPTRESAPTGAPCWTDLWTSDVEGSRRFYADLFGWEAGDPSPEYGGYFMFFRQGVPVAGGMGDMGDTKADNRWKLYLHTSDIQNTTEVAAAEGAQIVAPPDGRRRPRLTGSASRPDRGGRRSLAAGYFPRLHGSRRARHAELVRAAHEGLRQGGVLLPAGVRLGVGGDGGQ